MIDGLDGPWGLELDRRKVISKKRSGCTKEAAGSGEVVIETQCVATVDTHALAISMPLSFGDPGHRLH